MNVLVAAASRHGATKEIAAAIVAQLQIEAIDAKLADASDVTSVEGFDAVIIGSGIYMGSWLSDATHLVERFEPQLVQRPVWLFSSGPLGEDASGPSGDADKLARLVERTHARGHRDFAGKLDRETLGLGERLIVKVVHAPEGDFRDWDDVRGWAHEIAEDLRLGDVPDGSGG